MFHQDVFCKDSIGYHCSNTPYFIPSPRSWVWLCPLVYSEHSDRLTGVTLCSTWLNAAQQWSNDVHTAYSPGWISHSRTTADCWALSQNSETNETAISPLPFHFTAVSIPPLPASFVCTHSLKSPKSISAKLQALPTPKWHFLIKTW